MKKLLIIFLLIFLTGCSQPILQAETIPVVTVTIIETVIVEDTAKIIELEKQLVDSKEETEKYQSLIANLNDLLKNIYYGYASNSNYILDGFTAFSMAYQGKYYLITVGHAVENVECGKMTNFKFKANFSDTWIYPELLDYNNDFENNRDYAIFYSDKIKKGLKFGTDINSDLFILGAGRFNVFRTKEQFTKAGESGSAIININYEVVGILIGLEGMQIGRSTPIGTVLQAIDNIE